MYGLAGPRAEMAAGIGWLSVLTSFCIDIEHMAKDRVCWDLADLHLSVFGPGLWCLWCDWLQVATGAPLGDGRCFDLINSSHGTSEWRTSGSLKQSSGEWLSGEFKSPTRTCPSGNLYCHEYFMNIHSLHQHAFLLLWWEWKCRGQPAACMDAK